MPAPLATIIIPQYMHLELTRQCLRTLRECDPVPWPAIVVDDGSSEEALRAAELDSFPQVTLIRQSHRGVTAAWNLGWPAVTTPWVIFLNNDVVSHGPWVEQLVQPLIDGEAHMTGVNIRQERFLPHEILERLTMQRFIEGWCFAMSKMALQVLNGFDAELLTYWSDTDLQVRLMLGRSSSCSLLTIPDLPLEHLGHATAHDPHCLPRQRDCWQADRRRFIDKWKTIDRPAATK
ncbi:MAG: glycosyltransferase family 2 protein [Planctomycetaceae bacterium]